MRPETLYPFQATTCNIQDHYGLNCIIYKSLQNLFLYYLFIILPSYYFIINLNNFHYFLNSTIPKQLDNCVIINIFSRHAFLQRLLDTPTPRAGGVVWFIKFYGIIFCLAPHQGNLLNAQATWCFTTFIFYTKTAIKSIKFVLYVSGHKAWITKNPRQQYKFLFSQT